LWLALYEPYDFYTACNFSYEGAETSKMLSRVLRLPSMVERIVACDETPLARPAEVLRYQLQPARDESEDYGFGLTLADGSPAPAILLAVPGQPALYLTERAIFEGPMP